MGEAVRSAASRPGAQRCSRTSLSPLFNECLQIILMSASGTFRTYCRWPRMSVVEVPPQPVDATQASNLSAGVSNCKVSRGRSLS
jgi:hypothetical protein